MEFVTSIAQIEVTVTFHSLRSIRLLEAAEGEGGGAPYRIRAVIDSEEARRKDAILEELQAHQVRSAAALERVIDQVEKLAVGQAQAHEQTSKLADSQAASQEHARQGHASLAAEPAVAINTVNQLAGIFTSFLARERDTVFTCATLRVAEAAPPAGPDPSRTL